MPLEQARGTNGRMVQSRGTGRPGLAQAVPGTRPVRSPRPYFIHLALGSQLPIRRPVLESAVGRIREELDLVSPRGERGGAFFIYVHGSVDDDEMLQLGPRDLPFYMLRPEDARLTLRLVNRHFAGRATLGAANFARAQGTIAGSTADSDEHGINLNVDVGGIRRGISLIRVEKQPRLSDAQIANDLGETVLHEFGHHLLDPDAHRFGALMSATHSPGGPKRRFSAQALTELRRRIAALP